MQQLDAAMTKMHRPAFSLTTHNRRRTRLATRVSELLACEQQPVLRLAVAADERSLWAATTSPSVHKWQVEAREPPALALPVSPRSPAPAGGGPAPIAGSFFHASPSVAARARLAFDLHGGCRAAGCCGHAGCLQCRLLPTVLVLLSPGQAHQPILLAWFDAPPHPPSCCAAGTRPSAQQLQPLAATPGMPPIQHAAVLTDRRHVLTQDAEGRVQMWDVTAGAGSPSASLWLHGKQVFHELDCCSASSSPVLPAVAL